MDCYSIRNCLLRLLRSGGSLLSSLGLELAVDVSLSEGLKDRGLAVLVRDLARSDRKLGSLDGDDVLVGVLSNVGQLLAGGVTLLGLTLLGEDNQLSLELLDSVNVGGNSLLVLVSASLVNSDTDGSSELHGNTSLLELNGGEAATLADLEVVSLGGRNNNWSQQTGNRSGENSGGLSLTSQSSGLMTSWLVEPGSNISVMLRNNTKADSFKITYVLLEVNIGQHVVSNRHC